jgi:hypothetical protein
MARHRAAAAAAYARAAERTPNLAERDYHTLRAAHARTPKAWNPPR